MDILDQLESYRELEIGARTELLIAIRRKVMAGMESGNPSDARTLVRELQDQDVQAAFAIRADVIASYGMDL